MCPHDEEQMSTSGFFPDRVAAWREAWSDRRFRFVTVATFAIAAPLLIGKGRFLRWVEGRDGVVLPDPLLRLFSPVDISELTFTVTYTMVLASIAAFSRYPRRFVLAFQCYLLLCCLRMVMMLLVPFAAPPEQVLLRDPFIEAFVGSSTPLSRDLFFSGHTSTPFVFGFAAPTRRIRVLLFAAAVLAASLVLAQHAHYTIDVVIAPFVAYAAYRLVLGVWGDTESHTAPHRGANVSEER